MAKESADEGISLEEVDLLARSTKKAKESWDDSHGGGQDVDIVAETPTDQDVATKREYGGLFDDYQWVVDEGPWMIFGRYLTVYKWKPGFRPEADVIDRTMVWVRFPRMPIEFYNENLLFTIDNTLGKCIKVDERTLSASHGRFAKVCIEVALDKPLIPKIELEGEWQSVEYEGLPQICYDCERAVHKDGVCENKPVSMDHSGEEANGNPLQKGPMMNNPVFESNPAKEAAPMSVFGPWMQPPARQSRRNNYG